MQAFIHASAGEFNGLRLAWIGRAVFSDIRLFESVLDLTEGKFTSNSKRYSTLWQATLRLLEYMQTIETTTRQ